MNSDKINVLLTGATGSVGLEALKMLNNDTRLNVRTFDRDSNRFDEFLSALLM